MRQTMLLLILSCCFSLLSFAADISPITSAVQKGNAAALAKLLDAKADVSVSSETATDNAAKAQTLLQTFFSQNKPSSLKVLHHSDGENAGFFVGKLQTAKGEFRINIDYRSKGKTITIQSIRIE